jgi:hypothetical protein
MLRRVRVGVRRTVRGSRQMSSLTFEDVVEGARTLYRNLNLDA